MYIYIYTHILPVFSLDSQHPWIFRMVSPRFAQIFPRKIQPPSRASAGVDGLAGPQQGSHQGLLRRRHQRASAKKVDGNPNAPVVISVTVCEVEDGHL